MDRSGMDSSGPKQDEWRTLVDVEGNLEVPENGGSLLIS
jgi:hypothetical protein